MFDKVLIANRGVAAVRIARTLHRLGVAHVIVYSQADAQLPYVRDARESYCIGPGPARESYLDQDALLRVLAEAGCDAVHPGYGFLAENAGFARRVQAAGAAFVGPAPELVDLMGDKLNARRAMAAAGVPVLTASGPVAGDDDDLQAEAQAVGYPLLVKASAGGGGIGMRRVDAPEALAAAVNRTRALAARTFGDDTVYLERRLDAARHVEFQIIGARDGMVRALFERDCSVQRRHQKVIEESPAPRAARDRLHAMGERLAAALASMRYTSLGTVEMLMDSDGAFHFLETNTRLQVEHGVTEAITGIDLVEAQLRIAAGARLDEVLPQELGSSGHALELRVYAEDPDRFLPSTGTLECFRVPHGEGVRVDSALQTGAAVTPFYDPMLALVIVHGADRDDAIARALAALDDFEVRGVKTNIEFLRRVLQSPAFREARHHVNLATQPGALA